MYPITVVINDAGGSMTTDTGSTTVADAPLTAGTITAAGGVEYTTATTLTAKFTDANANAPTSDFSGTINWGDGAPGSPDITTFTSSAVTGSAGSYSVSGSHQYAEDGMYPITVVINDAGGSMTTDTGSATVADAPLTGSSSAAATGGVAGVTAATLANATFSDANLNAPSSDFTVTAVAWGDGGTSTAGLTVSGSNGSYSVNGSHLYTASGTFSFSITVTDDGGQTATITGSATVAAASNLISSVAVNGTTDAFPISTASESNSPAANTVTITTAAPTDFQVGQEVMITGVAVSGAPLGGTANAYNNIVYSRTNPHPAININNPTPFTITAVSNPVGGPYTFSYVDSAGSLGGRDRRAGDRSELASRFGHLVHQGSGSHRITTVAVTTSTPHGFYAGERVSIANVGTGYDGVWTIASSPAPTSTTFSYTYTTNQGPSGDQQRNGDPRQRHRRRGPGRLPAVDGGQHRLQVQPGGELDGHRRLHDHARRDSGFGRRFAHRGTGPDRELHQHGWRLHLDHHVQRQRGEQRLDRRRRVRH